MQLERLGDLPADGEDRIQARHRVLEDHRDVVAADAPDLVVVHLQDVLTVEDDRALDDAAGGLRNETHQRERGDRFPHPDSPTSPRVSPASSSNDTPSTARTTPSRVKNCVLRSL